MVPPSTAQLTSATSLARTVAVCSSMSQGRMTIASRARTFPLSTWCPHSSLRKQLLPAHQPPAPDDNRVTYQISLLNLSLLPNKPRKLSLQPRNPWRGSQARTGQPVLPKVEMVPHYPLQLVGLVKEYNSSEAPQQVRMRALVQVRKQKMRLLLQRAT